MRAAWKSQGRNQRDLVRKLRKANIIRSDAVEKVMERVDRGNYYQVSDDDHPPRDNNNKLCYADRALVIGSGQTISAPHMHAYALEEIFPSLAKKRNSESESVTILDVGCGSGYLTACFGRYVSTAADQNNRSSGKVFGIDVRRDLVDTTTRNMLREDGDLLREGVVDLSLRDGWKGLPEHAPFDAIHVGAAASTLPKILANQLGVGGVMVIPIGPSGGNQPQVLYRIRRVSGGSNSSGGDDETKRLYYSSEDSFRKEDFEIKRLLGVRYVPLVKGEEL
eukprot:CAMPEP_0201138364 /NCGR_PEP_ID=MMETSP0850-20130426/55892_1 /ASSEMBLY_ACC=CAM_ASM_000622 /TAXON_ID=183588 /ORGANISM="Pseudo-nitzschia fraudulenta, Strain WWA7" /LENGTH=278 /DNA_ID=CAMNT_0047409757 /DNA_START=383 /DNA_END=1219 /DNA_ORIENTATION=-